MNRCARQFQTRLLRRGNPGTPFTDGRHTGEQVAAHGEHHGDDKFRHGIHVALRRIDDGNAAFAGCRHVNGVDAYPMLPDNLQFRRGGDLLPRHRGGAYNDRIGIRPVVFRWVIPCDDFRFSAQQSHGFRMDRFQNDNLHKGHSVRNTLMNSLL